MKLEEISRPLIVAGATLFLIGLLQGSIVHAFMNPRMALSAHLTAVQSGTALMAAGIVWNAITLRKQVATLTCWLIVLGFFGLWTGLTLSAATGASESLPMAGAGFGASWMTEKIVSALVVGSSTLLTIGWLVFVFGLLRQRESETGTL